MKIKLVGSSIGAGPQHHFVLSTLVNDQIAFDAGSLGFMTPLEAQQKVEHVFLSHTHIDHIASLPIFLDNIYKPAPECPVIYGNSDVLECLTTHVFNERIWPDLIRISLAETPFLKMEEIQTEKPILLEAAGITVTPVALDHVVPSMGFILEDENSTVAIISDTAPTERVWEIVNSKPNLKAIFLEASFPNSFQWLADKSMHLTPNTFREQVAKLKADVPIIAVHVKPAFESQIVPELQALGIEKLEIGVPEKVYEF